MLVGDAIHCINSEEATMRGAVKLLFYTCVEIQALLAFSWAGKKL
jgi:hypothetical protein